MKNSRRYTLGCSKSWALWQLHGEEPDPEKILKNPTDSVVLLEQAINKMAYERRLSVLAELSKKMLNGS